ncbi:uncharacterized protein [Setaria viridis]|uniref:Uncharacterized protein n=1 Tax=Setaria viridis TaxID=4556 RepID=A0A4U6WED4_SETVI|nr:uncharacterized protein LOC117862124 isoform X3 [Setaria viridis]TKW40324.1 hypothetical protein SEVIR_1G238201v2 [Setaria viridis]
MCTNAYWRTWQYQATTTSTAAAPVSVQEVEAALQNFQMAPTPTDGTDDTAGLHGVSAAPVSIQEVDAALQDLQMAPAPTDSTYGTAGPHGGAEGGATDINSRAATTRGQDNTVVSALFTRPEQVLQVSPTEVHDEDQNQQQQQKPIEAALQEFLAMF